MFLFEKLVFTVFGMHAYIP